jgi:hypothetical protein
LDGVGTLVLGHKFILVLGLGPHFLKYSDGHEVLDRDIVESHADMDAIRKLNAYL